MEVLNFVNLAEVELISQNSFPCVVLLWLANKRNLCDLGGISEAVKTSGLTKEDEGKSGPVCLF